MSPTLSDRAIASALLAMATGLDAGATVAQLVGQPAIAATMPRRLVDPVAAAVGRGETATSGFRASGVLLRHEVALIEAAERTGKLPVGLALVAAGIEQRRRDARALVASIAYPTFLIAASSVLLPLPIIITQGLGAYLARAIWAPLIVGLAIAVFGIWFPRLPATDPRREIPRRLARRVPLLRGALRRVDTSLFARVLGQCISAGLGIFESLDAASASVDDPAMRRGAKTARARLEAGGTLADAIGAMRAFRPEVVAVVAQGEITGTLDRSLERIAEQEAEAGRRAVRRFLVGVMGVTYGAVMLFVAWRIVASFVGVLETIDQAVQFE